MEEVLRKNRIKAKMEALKLFMQAILISFFGLFLIVLREAEYTRIGLYIIVVALIGLFGSTLRFYNQFAFDLDKEEAKEREMKG